MNIFKSAFNVRSVFLIVLIFLFLPICVQAGSKSDFRYWFEKGNLFSVYGNQDAAIHAFQEAIKIEPENPEAHFNLGVAYAEKGDLEKALAAVDQAIALKPGTSRYYYGRGWMHIRHGNYDNGVVDMQKAADDKYPDAIKYFETIAPRKGD
jgi:tetratricopeptide (TPR) repeat protein